MLSPIFVHFLKTTRRPPKLQRILQVRDYLSILPRPDSPTSELDVLSRTNGFAGSDLNDPYVRFCTPKCNEY
jgi:hypothetical protein